MGISFNLPYFLVLNRYLWNINFVLKKSGNLSSLLREYTIIKWNIPIMRKSQQVLNSQILLSVSILLSIFFNPVIVFIKEIFISHSKNVVTDKWRAVSITKNRFINQVRWILFLAIFFYTQKCVNKKTGKKSFSPHKLWEKNYRQKSRIAFLMKSFLAQINCSHSYMMCH